MIERSAFLLPAAAPRVRSDTALLPRSFALKSAKQNEQQPAGGREMSCFTSASVKCEINETNEEIIIDALIKELKREARGDIILGDNSLLFQIPEEYNIFIDFDLLPDRKGYSIKAQGFLYYKVPSKFKSFCVFLFKTVGFLTGLVLCLIITYGFSVISGIVAYCFLLFFCFFSPYISDFKQHKKEKKLEMLMKKVFEHAFSVFKN